MVRTFFFVNLHFAVEQILLLCQPVSHTKVPARGEPSKKWEQSAPPPVGLTHIYSSPSRFGLELN